MKLYEGGILSLLAMLSDYPCRVYHPHTVSEWPDEGKNQMIFQSDMAYELGGGGAPALSGIALTDNEQLVGDDCVCLYGQELSQLTEDAAYARITLVRVKNTEGVDSDALYQMNRRIDYTRYHVSPKGFMMRISAMNQREVVRIGKDALAEGLSFAQVGKQFIEAYHKHPEVEAVKVIFVTLPTFPYAEAEGILRRWEDMTKTLDHLAKKVQMDCHACALKEVCEEVEALYKK